jgi:REP element-mobilizing transposase RayT
MLRPADKQGAIMPGLPARRSIRLRGFDYRADAAYFVTIVTFRRACLLGAVVDGSIRLSTVGELVEAGRRAVVQFSPQLRLDSSVVMPNHIHGTLVVGDNPRAKHSLAANASPLHRPAPKGTHGGSISAIVQNFKSTTTRRVHSLTTTKGLRLWQRGFYDHVIRDEPDLDRIRRYIEENPLRWALDEENPASRTT